MDPTACPEAWVDAAHWFTAVFFNLDSFQEYGYGPRLSEFPTSMGIAGAEVPPTSLEASLGWEILRIILGQTVWLQIRHFLCFCAAANVLLPACFSLVFLLL